MNDAEILELIRRLRKSTDAAMRTSFDRSLSFADTIFDRWERSKWLGFGEGTSIYDSALIYGDVIVGDNTWIGPNTLLDGSGGQLKIGSHVAISAGVQIYSHDSVLAILSGGALPKIVGAVTIGNNVYIGSQSIIAPRVSIGSRAVVAANSFVNCDVPERIIVGGSPARPIGRVVGEGENIQMVFSKKQVTDAGTERA